MRLYNEIVDVQAGWRGFSFLKSFHRFILSIQFFDLNVEDDLGKIRKADVLIRDYDIKTECTNLS